MSSLISTPRSVAARYADDSEPSSENPLVGLPDGDAVRRRQPEAVGLREHALQELRARVLTGSLGVDQVHRESELALALNVSRTPVREALAILSAEGIIRMIPQTGFTVRAVSEPEADELMAMRTDLEARVLQRLTSGRCNPAWLQRAGNHLNLMRGSADRNDQTFWIWDLEFHTDLAHAAGLTNAARVLTTWLTAIRVYQHGLGMDTALSTICDEHAELFEAAGSAESQATNDVFIRYIHASRDRLHLSGDSETAPRPQARAAVHA